jgi:hypothetical protein
MGRLEMSVEQTFWKSLDDEFSKPRKHKYYNLAFSTTIYFLFPNIFGVLRIE